MKKIFLFVLIFLMTAVTHAQVVTVNGYGVNQSAAIIDAKRNAVEQVIGTYLQSQSMMEDLAFVMDKVETRTQGYINSFEILSESKDGTNISIIAKADVSDSPSSALMQDLYLVNSLKDPRLKVSVQCAEGNNFSTMTTAAIRSELINHGFSHVVDSSSEVDYLIVGNLIVKKIKNISLPNWSTISSPNVEMQDTGLKKSSAILDCKIKKFDTGEIIGEFHVNANDIGSDEDVQSSAVSKIASNAAQEVRNIFSHEAAKLFKSVKIFVKLNNPNDLTKFENELKKIEGVNEIFLRGFNSGKSTIDISTGLSPYQIYQMLDNTKIKLNSFTSTTLDITFN